MSGVEINKICGAVLLAGLVAMLTSFVAKQLVHPALLDRVHYPLAELEPAVAGGRPEPIIEPVGPLLAEADIERGQRLSRKCTSCHTFSPDLSNKVGPGLWNVVGRPPAQVAGFAYSQTLQALTGMWNYEKLSAFLTSPKRYARGTNMNFVGLRSVEDRADLIAWLRTLSENPAPLP